MKKSFKSAIKCLLMGICMAGVGIFMVVSTAYAEGTILSDEWSIGDGTYHASRGYNSGDSSPYYAEHNTTQWQELGYTGGLGDYGVSWSTDGGLTWGKDDLYVGDTVTFRFNMHSENVGNHYANILKGWIDWDTDADSYEFNDAEEVVFGFKKLWSKDPTKDPYDDSSYYAKKIIQESYGFDNKDLTYDFDNMGGLTLRDGYNYGDDDVASEYTITLEDTHVGTAYLRARVTCSDSLGTSVLSSYAWADQWGITSTQYQNAFDAYSDYGQGEIEDWMFTVLGNPGSPGNPVPEPATLALFGMGLLGLARIGRKKA